MPILQNDGPPVSAEAIERARRELPREYGIRVHEERGRRVLFARVPRAKPDYNYELADVALYASLADVKDAKDVIMVGDEKSVRMDPVRLRDHIREQVREDAEVAQKVRATLPRADGAWTVTVSPMNHHHRALAFRIPVERLADAGLEQFKRARAALGPGVVETLRGVQFVYFVADTDYGRVGRRVFVESLAPDVADAVAMPDALTANPLHLMHQTPGGTLRASGDKP